MKNFKKMLILMVVLTYLIAFSAIAQTCKPEILPATTPISRFVDNNDGTVTDVQTGLMWKKCIEGLTGSACETGLPEMFTWQQALQRAQLINSGQGFAGYTDWRLPNVKELRSIVEEQCYDPGINLNIFPATPSYGFWSSSTSAGDVDRAWCVHFNGGYDYWYSKSNELYIRLVRGGR